MGDDAAVPEERQASTAHSGPEPASRENPGTENPENTEHPEHSGEERFRAFRQAEVLVRRRRPLDALKVLEPVLDADPDKPSVQLLAARAYFHSAQLRRAEDALNKVVERDPSDHYARFVLGRTLQRLGRLVEALAQLRMASAMNPVPEYQDAIGEVSARLALGNH